MKKIILLLVILAGAFGGLSAAEPTLNTLSDAEKTEGWKLLFDGRSFAGWHGYGRSDFPAQGWSIEDGCLKNAKGTGRPRTGGGDLVTTERFTDFEFRFEWRIAPGGNSGLYYFVHDRTNAPGAKMYVGDDGRSAAGHEYQLLDDLTHPDGVKGGPTHQTAALYALIPPNDSKQLKPVGEFNESRLVVQGRHVEHWLNGTKVVDYELGSPALAALIAKSKYQDVPGFGTKFATPLLIQDHGDEVWLRNLKIRVLPTATK